MREYDYLLSIDVLGYVATILLPAGWLIFRDRLPTKRFGQSKGNQGIAESNNHSTIGRLAQADQESNLQLPDFGPKAELFDVEGIPVSLFPDAPGVPFSMAWDVSPPRVFPSESAERNGVRISLEAFKELVARSQAGL